MARDEDVEDDEQRLQRSTKGNDVMSFPLVFISIAVAMDYFAMNFLPLRM